MFEYNCVLEINECWCAYDKTVAECHLANYGKIYVDEYNQPIDDEYLLEMIAN
jgi:hypothetical protein